MIPEINGINPNQSVQVGSSIDPFNGITVTDGNDYLSDTTLTIKLLDQNGNASDNNGSLVLGNDGNGDTMQETSPGVYVLTDTQPASPSRTLDFFTHQLPALQFIPTTAATTTMQMTELDKYNETTTSNLTVNASGSGTPATPLNSNGTNNVATPSNTTSDIAAAPGDITENNAVPAGQVDTVAKDHMLTLNDPKDFGGKVNFKSGIVDLNNLAGVDSYSFKNDMLSLYSGGNVVDTLAFTANSATQFAISKSDSGSVAVYTANDPRHSSTDTLIPMHS